MRAAKTSEIGFRRLVARGIRELRLAGRPDDHHRRSPVSGRFETDAFDKRRCYAHPRKAMTTARTRIPALAGLILLVVIFILP
jgi:hypothetical protein